MHFSLSLLDSFDRWCPTSASTVDGERPLSPKSQSLEFRSGYAHSRRPLPRDCQSLRSIYYNGSTLLLPWSCFSSTSSDQPLLCPQCLGGENKVKYLILKALIQLLWIRAFRFFTILSLNTFGDGKINRLAAILQTKIPLLDESVKKRKASTREMIFSCEASKTRPSGSHLPKMDKQVPHPR